MIWKKYFDQWRSHFQQLRGDPHYIALGMAVGCFVGVTPTVPFHTALSLGLAALLRGSKRAATLGQLFGNPLTLPPLYLIDYKLGSSLLGLAPQPLLQAQSMGEWMCLGLDVFAAALLGGAVLGIVPAVLGYWVTYRLVAARQARIARMRDTQ